MSQDRKNKNDYSCIIFLKNGKTMKMQYVHNIYALHNWLNGKRIDYEYINVYLRRSGQFIHRQYYNNFITAKP